MNHKNQKIITKILFIIYLMILTWIILFKMQTDFSQLVNTGYRNINLIPFQGSLETNRMMAVNEIIMNVIIFLPFGVYISMLKESWNILRKAAPVFFTSFAFETLQYIFAIGASDITDLIGNTLGGLLGIVLFWILSKVLKDHTIRTINILAAVGTVLVAGLLGIITIANL